MKYFELHILNSLKRSYEDHFNEKTKIMGSQPYSGKSGIGNVVPTQLLNGSKKWIDFFNPSSDLSGRVVISNRGKELIETFRNDCFQFFPCPIIKSKEPINGFWITEKVIFDDELIDFEQSIFEFIDVIYLGGEVSKLENYNEKITEMKFSNARLLWDFKKNRQNHLSRIHPKKIIIRDTCILPILNFKTIGVFYLIVSEELKNELQKQKMDKGIEFKPLEIPDEEWFGPNGLRKQFYK
jgi:hypothetical protein